MNNPIKMYRTKQIVQHNLPVQLPNCMYKLNNIHSGRNGMVDGSSDHVSSPNKKLDIIDQVKQFLKVLFIFNIIKAILKHVRHLFLSKTFVLTRNLLKITCMTHSYQFLRTTVK